MRNSSALPRRGLVSLRGTYRYEVCMYAGVHISAARMTRPDDGVSLPPACMQLKRWREKGRSLLAPAKLVCSELASRSPSEATDILILSCWQVRAGDRADHSGSIHALGTLVHTSSFGSSPHSHTIFQIIMTNKSALFSQTSLTRRRNLRDEGLGTKWKDSAKRTTTTVLMYQTQYM